TVVGRSHRCIDPSEGGLMQIVKRDLLVARTEEFASIPRRFAVRCGQRQGPLPRHGNVGRGSLLGQGRQREAEDEEQTNPPCAREQPARRHTRTSLWVTVPVCAAPSPPPGFVRPKPSAFGSLACGSSGARVRYALERILL